MAKMPMNFKKKSVNADDDGMPMKGKKPTAKKHTPPAKKPAAKKRK